MYYMNGDVQKVIAERVGVSEQTISSWVDKEGWAARRAGIQCHAPGACEQSLAGAEQSARSGLRKRRYRDDINTAGQAGKIRLRH